MGYTDGVAKSMSEASAQGKLFLIDSFTYKDSNYNSDDLDSEALSPHFVGDDHHRHSLIR